MKDLIPDPQTAVNITDSGLIDFTPDFTGWMSEDPEPEGFWVGGVGTGFAGNSYIGGVAKVAMQEGVDYDDRPADWTLQSYFDKNPHMYEKVKWAFDDPEAPMADQLLEDLGQSYNDGLAGRAITQWQSVVENTENFNNHPVGYVLGAAGGIVSDIALTVATLPAATIPNLAMRLERVGSVIANGARMSRLAQSARWQAGLLTGAAAATEGVVSTGLQALTDPSIEEEDILLTGMISALIGGGLGAAFPKAVGGILQRMDRPAASETSEGAIEAARDAAGRPGVEQPRAAGAMEAPEDLAARRLREEQEFIQQARSGDPLVMRRGTGQLFRNPLNVLRNYGARGRKDMQEGMTGNATFFDAMARIFRPSVTMQHELQGKAAVMDARSHYNLINTRMKARMAQADIDYREMLKDVFQLEDGWLNNAINAAKRTWTNSDTRQAGKKLIERVIRKEIAEGRLITLDDFMLIADRMASRAEWNERAVKHAIGQGRGAHPTISIEEAIPPHLRDRGFSQDMIERMIKHAEKVSKDDDKFFEGLQAELEGNGLLDAADIVSHYRTRLWDGDKVAADHPRLHAALLDKVWRKSPDRDWFNQSFPVFKEAKVDPKTGKELPAEIDTTKVRWEEDQDWMEVAAKLSNEDPDLYDEVVSEWGDVIKRAAEDKAIQLEDKAKAKVDHLKSAEMKAINAKWDAQYEAAEKRLKSAKAALRRSKKGYTGNKTWKERKAALEKQKANAEQKMFQIDRARKEAAKVFDDTEAFKKLVNKTLGRKASSKIKEAQEGLRQATKRVDTAAAAKAVNVQIEELLQKMQSKGGQIRISDLKGEEMTAGGSRLMRRMIDLKEHVLDPDFTDFMHTNPMAIRGAYTRTVGARLATRKAMRPLFEREGKEFGQDVADRQTFESIALKGFEDDMTKARAAGDTKLLKRLEKDRKDAQVLLNRMMDDIDGIAARAKDEFVKQAEEIALGGTAIASLGSMIIAQLGDLAVSVMAGSRLGTGFHGMLRHALTRKTWHAIQENDEMLSALAYGSNVLDGSRFRAMMGTELEDMMTPGSFLKTSQAIMREAGHWQGMANFAHYWNVWVRSSFGVDFMRQIRTDLMDWDNLKDIQKEFYHRHGVSSLDAKEIKEMFDVAHVRVGPGKGVMLPDRKVWEDKRPDLMAKYDMLVQRAGDEALLAPQMGDLPFMKHNLPFMGPIILQFAGFMFSAGERLIPRLIQNLRQHPMDPAAPLAILMGFGMGGLVDLLKDLYYGKSYEAWADQEMSDRLWGAAVRSPFLAGMSSTMADAAFTQFGGGFNEAVGAHVLPQSPSKFKQQQGLASMLGPFVGQSWGLTRALSDFSEDGDGEKLWGRVQKLLPIINTVGLQVVARAYEDSGD